MRKLITILTVLLLLILQSVPTSAGYSKAVHDIKDGDIECSANSGKWGCSEKGKTIIPYKYDAMEGYYAGPKIAKIKLDGKWGYIHIPGKEIISPKYDEVSSPELFQSKDDQTTKNDLVGRDVKNMATVSVAPKYDSAGSFFDGMAVVKINNKWGFIDKTGREVVSPKYDSVRNFSDGMAAVEINNKWGFIDKTGREIVSLKYDNVQDFAEDLAVVGVKSLNDVGGRLYGFINKTGREIVSPRYAWAGRFHDERASVQARGKNGKWTIIDKTGNEVIPPKYGMVYDFSEGMAAVRKFTKSAEEIQLYGFIDKTGKEIVPLIYNSVTPFSEGRAFVTKIIKKPSPHDGGTIAKFFINKPGKKAEWPRPPQREENALSGWRFKVKLNGKWGYVDSTDTVVVPMKFDELPNLSETWNKFFRIKINGKYGYVDAEGNEIVPVKYDEAPVNLYDKSEKQELRRVAINNKYGYLDRMTAKEIIPPKYSAAPEFLVEEKTKVKLDGKWGYIDRQGNAVSAFEYEEDPCTFDKKKGDHYVFGDRVDMRSKPDASSDMIAKIAGGEKIKVVSQIDRDLTVEDETDRWYEVKHEGKTGYVWGGDIADSAYTVSMTGKDILILIRNRTNGANQCYTPKFNVKMISEVNVLSEYSGRPFTNATVRMASVKFASMAGFTAPLKLLTMKYDFTGYKDKYAESGTGVVFFYINDGKLNKVLDMVTDAKGGSVNISTDLIYPDKNTRTDTITLRVKAGMGFLPTHILSESNYRWDWDKKTFVYKK